MSLLNILGIGTAYASTSTSSTESSLISMLPMLIIFVVVFYFLLIRPQSKRTKEHRKLIDNVQKGDEVLTTGGVVGKIAKMSDDFIELTIAKGVDITIQKSSIAATLPKGTLKTS